MVLLRNAGLRSTKIGGQSFLLDWGGGWAFISMNVKSVAMIHRQRSKLAFLNFRFNIKKGLRKFANIRCIEAKEAKRGEAKRSKMERKGSTFKFQD